MKERTLSCKDCPYYWDDEEFNAYNKGEEFDPKNRRPICHYIWNDNDAPCEVSERKEEEEEYVY